MKNEPKTSPITIKTYHPKPLQTSILAWNDSLALIERQRAELSRDADALRDSIFAEGSTPENLPAEILKLEGRRLALDVAESRLITRKGEFKAPHAQSRLTERESILKRANARKAEIEKALSKAKVETRFMPGLINEDIEVRQLTIAAGELSSFETIVTDEDDKRAAMLAQRIAAAVPHL